jgi:hypothetical protein
MLNTLQNAFLRAFRGLNLGYDLFSMLVVDLMHEFELGVWKMVFRHLIQILEAVDSTLLQQLNQR